MTHDTAITTLLSVASKGEHPDPGLRAAAEAHVADCSDCWQALAELVHLVTGSPPENAAGMAARYGCADVRDEIGRAHV